MPSIIEFVESPHYLNLPAQAVQPVNLYPLQRIVLKTFYRGTPGNEHLKLTEEEKHLLRTLPVNHEYIIDKFDSNEIFRELILVFGRRSGKNMISSIIALYEAARLIEMGDPFAYYHLDKGTPLCILTVARAEDQAAGLFDEIKTKVAAAPYFKGKIGSIENSQIFLKTDADKEQNKENALHGLPESKGSILILCGHSNSNTLRGKRCPLILFDEVSSYAMYGQNSGDQLYQALLPCTSDFLVSYEENGVTKKRIDSKVVTISSPKSKEGILWRSYNLSLSPDKGKKFLSFRAATWNVNPNVTQEILREQFPTFTEEQFAMEIAAEFASTGGEKFLSDEIIDAAIDRELGQKEKGVPGYVHYAHLDPAATSHNYALTVVHIEDYIRQEIQPGTNEQKAVKHQRYVVDHLMVWKPNMDREIVFDEVDDYIINLAKRMRLGMVSYDTFECRSSMQKLRRAGIPVKVTPFGARYKTDVYRRLEYLFNSKNIVLPGMGRWADLLINELKALKRKFTANGFKIMPNPEGLVTTDDLCDSLAGACAIATDTEYTGLAKPELAYMPNFRNNTIWKIGQGSYNSNQITQYGNKILH